MLLKHTDIQSRCWTVPDSFAFCERLAQSHYENFPVASLLLPRNRRKYVAAIYAFARIADDFADEPGYTLAERLDSLNKWQDHLASCYAGPVRHPVFVALGETARRFEIPQALFERLLSAFRQDIATNRYKAFDDVRDYCRHSADPVGRIVLLLFNYRDERLMEMSDAVCTALQLTNFWQDLSRDFSRGRLYIPQNDLDQFGCTENDFLTRKCTTRFQHLMEFEVNRTETFFQEGKPLLQAVSRDLRMELALTWRGGMAILQKIREQRYDVFTHRPVLTAGEKLRLLFGSIIS